MWESDFYPFHFVLASASTEEVFILYSPLLDTLQWQVIDEIDGALSGAEGKGAIDALLEIVRINLWPLHAMHGSYEEITLTLLL